MAQRRVPINYPKRMVRGKLYGGQSSYLPIKVNISGVIPPIFASSILMFPLTVAKFVHHPVAEKFAQIFAWGTWPYLTVYGLLIIFFAYFYTAIIFNPKDVADNLRKYGGFIPGIRPGQKTAEYIERIVNRLTFVGALYLVAVCILPSLLIKYMHVPFYFGGTALLIVVGVALDTMQQIESHLIMRHYEGLMKRSPILGG